MSARLVISENAYSLLEAGGGQWSEIALLAKGAAALFPGARPVNEAGLEAAIEVAEDWLMPHAARLRGEILEVEDPTGRLKSGLDEVLAVESAAWTIADVEGFFLRLVDLATGRLPAPGVQARWQFAADLLLLRELAHHGQLRELRLA
jgi:hypothetical protein